MIKAVVFDLDGTLMDHDGAALTGLRSWWPTLGATSLAPAEVEAVWFALERRHYHRYVAGELSYQAQRRVRTSAFLGALGLPVPSDLDSVFNGYLAAYLAAWRAYDDALPALLRVRAAGLSTAVLTNGDHDQQAAKLRAIGLAEFCGPMFASSAIGAAKPSAAAYGAVGSALGHSPDELLMVGDDLELDVLGARAAGLRAVHLARSAPSTRHDSIASLAHLTW